ncbi:cryptochrome/photolyase family protein [Candidatus Neomicrothrix sp.]|jgi:deoxyribodipyrimidine photolyase-related protein|uniref:cryptochrome/photolyase family protein n=1 Tax=Candidatus Neomicrothrix sp. TaxID=2719034 RepID=UPI001B4DD39F|nr:cryptochrome/photolyase family protein [Candidatus Microthrix sp.]MBK6502757.1 cryptochrome/photolyase family protein [Candidatus Microthrix sp.]MBP6133982.1 cryptochrome/photolyase family protein [Candidatus Microthrix sp.]MBP6148742.1 cryptochrome/photolyase family protein [Candidatus Microthrix sp.]MBP7851327.1 cryptochrome/photolyase family protein [Candidatus Microthrix sp.]MBP7987596.1 cryptochrome/photolyase family protein [Candidatus Microthrix sp.]
MTQLDTVWVLGDQLNRRVGALADRKPGDCRVLLVTSEAKISSKRWHRQRLHLVLSAMAHFAAELRAEGFEVDHRRAPTLAAGLHAHRAEHDVSTVIAMEPMSWDGRAMLSGADVELVPNGQFLCHYDDFAAWVGDRSNFKMEDFYRWQRYRLDVLIEPDGEPVGGRWNFDHDNREPPPRDGRTWPQLTRFELDDIDRAVIADLNDDLWGSPPDGTWPVNRHQALIRLDEFVATGLERFGAHEDAMLAGEWKMAHSALSSSMNLGILHPAEIVDAVVAAHRAGTAPLNSVEGFLRQVIGWREYVWGLFWLWMPAFRDNNGLDADRTVPPAFTGASSTGMACVASAVGHVERHGYAHHIERLMVLGNLALTAGVEPQAMTNWMWASFVDGAEWVMIPNVVGMALHADGGRMATKPYASGGAYINKMSDSCKGCRYDPKKRVGDDACPFTTLYWDFLARHEEVFAGNHRMARQVAGMRRLNNLPAVRERAVEVLAALDAGDL